MIALSFASVMLFPLISFLLLYKSGVKLYNLTEAFSYICLLAKAKSVNILYTNLGFIPSISSLKLLLINFMKFLFFPIYFITHLFSIKEKFVESNAFFFNWIGLFSVILFILFCIKLRNKNYFNISDKMFFILFLSAIVCSYKCIFNISFNSYGTYFFPLLLICISIYLINYSVKRKKIRINFIIAVFMIVISSLYCISNMERSNIVYSQEKIKTEKGCWLLKKSK